MLCGSHTTFMRRLEERDQPLHGRRTGRIAVSPSLCRDVEAFVPYCDRRDQLRTYGIFGGLPGHLDELDPNQDLGRNVEGVARAAETGEVLYFPAEALFRAP